MSYQQAISLLSQGRANPSDYLVEFNSKVTSLSPKDDFADYISVFTRAITLPSAAHSAMALRGQENVGIQRNIFTGRNYGSPVVFTFTDRSDLVCYRTLKNWMDSHMVNSGQTGDRNLRANYYDSTKTDVKIYKLEPIRTPVGAGSGALEGTRRNHRISGIWNLINCHLLAIEQTTLSLESADSLLDWTASLSFESYSFESMDTPLEQYDGFVHDRHPHKYRTNNPDLMNHHMLVR